MVMVLLASSVAAATDWSILHLWDFENNHEDTGGGIDNSLTPGSSDTFSTNSKAGDYSLDNSGGTPGFNNTLSDLTSMKTLSLWVNVSSWGGGVGIFQIGPVGGYPSGIGIISDGSSKLDILFYDGSVQCRYTGAALTPNLWYNIVFQTEPNNCKIWINDAMVGNDTSVTGLTAWTYIDIGARGGATGQSDSRFDNIVMSDRYWTSTEITEQYNDPNVFVVTSEIVGEVDVNITLPAHNTITNISDELIAYIPTSTNSTLTNCSYYLNNNLIDTDLSIQNNTLNYFYDPKADGNYNISINCTDIEGNSDIDTVLNYTVDTTYPSQVNDFSPYYTFNQIVNINFTDAQQIRNVSIIDNCNISYVNASIGRVLYNYTYSSLVTNCSLGDYSTTLNYCDYAGNCNQDVYNWTNLGRLNITVRYGRDNSTILNYSISIDDVYNGNTTSGGYLLDNLTGSINISVDAPGYELGSSLYTVTNTFDYLNFTLYGTNSLLIYIYDEVLDTLVTDNITIDFSGSNGGAWTNISTTGEVYLENINATEYTIQFYNDIYALRTYVVTVGDRTSQTLNTYMINKTYNTIFTVLDQDTDTIIEGVSFGVYRQKAGDWSLVSNPVTDITGKVKFYYDPVANYRFYLNKDGYDDLIFYLNPIIFGSYNIQMETSTLFNYSFNLDDIAIVYGPHTFNNSKPTTFTFLINSPYGSLTNYGINLTYPGGSNYLTGSNAIGGALIGVVNISNATVFDVVRLEYFYTTTIAGQRNFTDQFTITFPDGTGTLTFMANKDKTFGLGIFERILIATLIAIFVVGIASLIGQPLPGFALNMFLQSYLTYIGFIPIWITLPSLLLGMMILIWKSGGT